MAEPDRSKCYGNLAAALDENAASPLLEIYLPSQDIASLDWPFAKFGLTDCGIAEVAGSEYLVLTDDFKVTSYLNGQGIDTLSFVNLKYGW